MKFCITLGPFTRLNADEVKFSIENMRDTLFRLLKVFHDTAGAKRIVEIVLSKVEKFYLNVPILQTICNPGMQERHWKKVSNILKFRKFLEFGLILKIL